MGQGNEVIKKYHWSVYVEIYGHIGLCRCSQFETHEACLSYGSKSGKKIRPLAVLASQEIHMRIINEVQDVTS